MARWIEEETCGGLEGDMGGGQREGRRGGGEREEDRRRERGG